MRSEVEEAAAPAETLLAFEVRGKRTYLPLAGFTDNPTALRDLLPFVTGVTSAREVVQRLLAPLDLDKGDSMVETLDTEIEQAYDPEAEAEELAAADERARHRTQDAMFRELERERAAREALSEEARARQAVLDVAEAKRWKIFQSPSRLKRDLDRAQRYAREVEWPNNRLLRERNTRIAAAVAEITAKISAEYHAACEQNKQTFADRERKRRA